MDHRGLLFLVEDARGTDGGGSPVDGAAPLQEQGQLDRLGQVGRVGDRAVVGHQRAGAVLECLDDQLGELRRAEGRVRRDPNLPTERQQAVVDARQCGQDARQRGGHRRVRVNDRAGRPASVEPEVQVDLGGRRELTRDDPPVEVQHGHLLRGHRGERRPGRGDRDQVTGAHADIARRTDDEPLGRQRPAGIGDRLSLGGQRIRRDGHRSSSASCDGIVVGVVGVGRPGVVPGRRRGRQDRVGPHPRAYVAAAMQHVVEVLLPARGERVRRRVPAERMPGVRRRGDGVGGREHVGVLR